jgi:hypothetical protein
MRDFGIDPSLLHRLWRPRQVDRCALDDYPRCVRCSRRNGYSTPIEAYGIADQGSKRVEILGRCRGVCERPWLEARLPKDEWVDAVRITWDRYSDANVDDERFQEALSRQISAIHFFDDEEVEN